MTQKVPKSRRSKMATLAHGVCDVLGAFSLYIKNCWQSLCRVFPTGRMGESPHQPNICSFIPSPPSLYSLPQKSIQPNKKMSFLAVVNAPVPILF